MYQFLLCSYRFLVRLKLDKGITLEKTSSAVKIDMDIFDLAILRKLVSDVFFLNQCITQGKSTFFLTQNSNPCFFVNPCNKKYPSLYGSLGSRLKTVHICIDLKEQNLS